MLWGFGRNARNNNLIENIRGTACTVSRLRTGIHEGKVHCAYYDVNDIAMNEWLNLASVLHRKLVSLSGISKPINKHELGHISAIFLVLNSVVVLSLMVM